MNKKVERYFAPVTIAVLVVSDSRVDRTDTTGLVLVDALQASGHTLANKRIVQNHPDHIRDVVSSWIIDRTVQVVITAGGTSLTGQSGTPDALRPLFDREIERFGELFRLYPVSTSWT